MNISPVENYGSSILFDKKITEKKLQLVEKKMLELDQVECNVVHRFSPGIYIREVTVPAGTFAIGHHQNFEHTNIFLKGRVTVLQEDGTTSELVAPMIFTGKPGRKIGYIHEDMVWLNVYATDETDIETLESIFLTKSDSWIESNSEKSLLRIKNAVDTDDYYKTLDEFGFTDEQARAQSYNTEDMTELPYGGYKIMVSSSAIEGKGLFATSEIQEDEVIAPARISGKRTIAGRYTNHSISPNARMVMRSNGDIDLVAIKNIKGCHGGQNGDEITINYREALSLQINPIGAICQE